MLFTISNSVHIKEPNLSTMSLYSRGAMRSSSQNSATWRLPPIFQLPPLDGGASDITRSGSILDGSLFLPPSLPSESKNTGHLETGMESDAEFSGGQQDESRSREAEASILTMNVAGLETSGEGDGVVNAWTTKSSIEQAVAKLDVQSEQATDSDLERMSPVRADFDTIITNAKRHLQPFPNPENKLGLAILEDRSCESNFDGNETEDTCARPEPVFERVITDKIPLGYYHRGRAIPITKESLLVQETLSKFQWPVGDDTKDEIQSLRQVTMNSMSGYGSVVLVERRNLSNCDEATTSDGDENTYLTDGGEEDGGVAIGDVKTLYEELADIQASLGAHPAIRDWNPSKFMEEWTKEDGPLQRFLDKYHCKLL